MTEELAFRRRSPPMRDAKGHAFPHTGPNPRGGRALPAKGRSPGSLSLLRPPSQDEKRPSGHSRHCRAYSGGSAPVSHRTSRTPFEVQLSVFITIRQNTRLSNEVTSNPRGREARAEDGRKRKGCGPSAFLTFLNAARCRVGWPARARHRPPPVDRASAYHSSQRAWSVCSRWCERSLRGLPR